MILTGGLEPTTDDLTRSAVAQALGRSIAVDERIVDHNRKLFASLGREMPEVNRRQAEVIAGAEVLSNRRGSAPGMRLEEDGAAIFLFPCVPRELDAMIEHHLEPWLRQRRGEDAEGIGRRVLKIACLPESTVEERIAPAYDRFGRDSIAVLASPGEVKVWAVVKGREQERERRLDEMLSALSELAGAAVFSDREEDTLESVVGDLLRRAGRTLVTAEPCTGGLVSQRLTDVAGSSDYFLGGVVSYTNELKSDRLGVSAETIAEHGAVSEPVARAMAAGARSRYRGGDGIGVTDIAGPSGGSEEKPVGTVHLAVSGPGDEDVDHRAVLFPRRPRAGSLAEQPARSRALVPPAARRARRAMTISRVTSPPRGRGPPSPSRPRERCRTSTGHRHRARPRLGAPTASCSAMGWRTCAAGSRSRRIRCSSWRAPARRSPRWGSCCWRSVAPWT